MDSDRPDHSVPLHPWEGASTAPSDGADHVEDDVDPVGRGPGKAEGDFSSPSPSHGLNPSNGTGGAGSDIASLAAVLYGADRTGDQVIDELRMLRSARPDLPALATRLSPDAVTAVQLEFPSAAVNEVARTCVLGELPPTRGHVYVVAAGSADLPIAQEAAETARVFGVEVELLTDVGTVEIHRLLTTTDLLDATNCFIVVSGMDGSLPSLVGGLTSLPVVAVPTSVGYGSSFGGMAALLSMLNSCTPGVVVCNIDNGFGAGVFAARVVRAAHQLTTTETQLTR